MGAVLATASLGEVFQLVKKLLGARGEWAECVVQDSAMSDADIQQAITDLGAKWGISV